MAAGSPIIATNIGGISEAIVDNVNGITVPVDDVEELVTAMMRLLRDPLLAARLGKQAACDCESSSNPQKSPNSTSTFMPRLLSGTRTNLKPLVIRFSND